MNRLDCFEPLQPTSNSCSHTSKEVCVEFFLHTLVYYNTRFINGKKYKTNKNYRAPSEIKMEIKTEIMFNMTNSNQKFNNI